ncbi:hypothetical protein BDF19DRAFT_440145, partial [Syncephalis fuscata]
SKNGPTHPYEPNLRHVYQLGSTVLAKSTWWLFIGVLHLVGTLWCTDAIGSVYRIIIPSLFPNLLAFVFYSLAISAQDQFNWPMHPKICQMQPFLIDCAVILAIFRHYQMRLLFQNACHSAHN